MRYPGYAYDVLHSGTTQEPPSGPPYRTSVHRCVRGAALWARPCDCEAVSLSVTARPDAGSRLRLRLGVARGLHDVTSTIVHTLLLPARATDRLVPVGR